MKNIFKLSVIALSCLLAAASCVKTGLDTDQYSDGVCFTAFAPNPVYRGGELTIIGSNLDQVKEVQIPGISPITDLKLSGSGRECKITFVLPKDGPEPGKIAIVDGKGNKYSSIAELSYIEPVVFTDFSPKSAMPGDVITITGDYMNLIQEVIFADGVIVSGEAVASDGRYTLKVAVPDEAITGRFAIGDSDELANPEVIANKIYSEAALTIGSPTVEQLGEVEAKAGEYITISGKYLGMIKSVSFEGATVEKADFLSSGGGKISLKLPALANSGEITATDFAGVSHKVGTLVCKFPYSLEATPQPVKAGDVLTITGGYLDLVTSIDLPGALGVAFNYDEETYSIKLTVPATATEGDILLNMANGNASAVAYTLVKPTLTAVSPLEIYAGDPLTVTGTDFDLLTGATLGGKAVEFELKSPTEAVLTTGPTSVSGKVALLLANGESIESEEEVTVKYHSKVIVTSIPASEHIGQPVSIKGSNLKLIENIFIGDTKVTDYEYRSDEQIVFFMPWCKVGSYPVTFHLFDGDDEVQALPIEVQLEMIVTTIWEGNEDMGSWSNQPYLGDEKGFLNANAAVGDKVRLYYAPYDDNFQIQIFDGHWGGMTFAELGGSNTIKSDTVPDYTGYFEFTITEGNLGQIANPQGWGGAMLVQGEKAFVTKLILIKEIPQEKELWSGSADLAAWSINWQIGDGTFGASNPRMFVDAGLKVGDEIRIYADFADWWQVQFFDGHWSGQAEIGVVTGANNGNNIKADIYDVSKGYISIPVNETIQTQLTTLIDWGYCWILQGEGTVIKKITIM